MSFQISFLVQKINQVKEITRGGWSGFGMVTVGIDPTDFKLNPTKIPPGGVVQNCQCHKTEKNSKKSINIARIAKLP